MYFSDPQNTGGPYDLAKPAIFRIDPAGAVHLVSEKLPFPNGVAFSPDGKLLYVTDASGQHGVVRSFVLHDDGSTDDTGDVVITTAGSSADGIAVDRAGNLYVATSLGVEVFAPGGRSWGVIGIKDANGAVVKASNCNFGDDDGKTLFITFKTALVKIRTAVPGLYY